MSAISDLLPASAHLGRRPTPDELDRTYPPGARRPSEGDAPHR